MCAQQIQASIYSDPKEVLMCLLCLEQAQILRLIKYQRCISNDVCMRMSGASVCVCLFSK